MQDGRKAVWSIPYVSVAFFPSLKQNFFVLPRVQITFLKFPRCDNQALVGCIPIRAVAVDLKLKSRVYDNFKCLYKKVWKLIEGTT